MSRVVVVCTGVARFSLGPVFILWVLYQIKKVKRSRLFYPAQHAV
jgi:hypothetical protein